jgi:hypothetical protein
MSWMFSSPKKKVPATKFASTVVNPFDEHENELAQRGASVVADGHGQRKPSTAPAVSEFLRNHSVNL